VGANVEGNGASQSLRIEFPAIDVYVHILWSDDELERSDASPQAFNEASDLRASCGWDPVRALRQILLECPDRCYRISECSMRLTKIVEHRVVWAESVGGLELLESGH
jgi:hypothetical protein